MSAATTRRRWVLLLALASAGCAGVQSALDTGGPQAERIAELWWVFLVVCTVVYVAVLSALALALARRPRRAGGDHAATTERTDDRGTRAVVAGAVGMTVLVLVIFVVYSVTTGRAITRMPESDLAPLEIAVTAHRWWWQVRYVDPTASRSFETANEIRIPTRRPVVIALTSRDVIHSFWVPPLHGKIDVIPGRRNTTWIVADEHGEYRGQCAEFCGIQHAKMAFTLTALPAADFEAWAEASRRPARVPDTEITRRGLQVFTDRAPCAMCHTIRGTGAWGQVAPDLTHIGTRRTIAAGTLANTRGNLAGWIVDPQHVKPGNFMPPTQLDADDLQALVAYLESLR